MDLEEVGFGEELQESKTENVSKVMTRILGERWSKEVSKEKFGPREEVEWNGRLIKAFSSLEEWDDQTIAELQQLRERMLEWSGDREKEGAINFERRRMENWWNGVVGEAVVLRMLKNLGGDNMPVSRNTWDEKMKTDFFRGLWVTDESGMERFVMILGQTKTSTGVGGLFVIDVESSMKAVNELIKGKVQTSADSFLKGGNTMESLRQGMGKVQEIVKSELIKKGVDQNDVELIPALKLLIGIGMIGEKGLGWTSAMKMAEDSDALEVLKNDIESKIGNKLGYNQRVKIAA